MEKYLDANDLKLLAEFEDYLQEEGLPVVIGQDPTKYISLSNYSKYSNHLINMAYNVENQLRRTQLALERAIAERAVELKDDGVSSATARKEAMLSGGSKSTTKIMELTHTSNELEALKWKIINKNNLISSILRLY